MIHHRDSTFIIQQAHTQFYPNKMEYVPKEVLEYGILTRKCFLVF